MIRVFRYVLLLFVLGCSAEASAQLSFMATDMVRIHPDSTKWKYSHVKCGGGMSVTSITVSMINNDIVRNTVTPSGMGEFKSLGHNPRVCTYTFGTTGIPGGDVETFVKGLVFDQTDSVPGKPQYIHIYVDANPIKLPLGGSTITVWREHPDGTPHYYMWVPDYKSHIDAYNEAKTYYFQGMRGYLPTITSDAEHALLINISKSGGWSGGARSSGHVFDAKEAVKIEPLLGDDESKKFKWVCGPESGFEYYKGPSHNSPPPVGILNDAYSPWVTKEPNNGCNGAADDSRDAEWCMQINFDGGSRGRGWNDLPSDPGRHIDGYFIEFGGTDQSYTVDGVTYPGNIHYAKPTEKKDLEHSHWPGYNPGATGFSEATVKERSMRSHVMVIQ